MKLPHWLTGHKWRWRRGKDGQLGVTCVLCKRAPHAYRGFELFAAIAEASVHYEADKEAKRL